MRISRTPEYLAWINMKARCYQLSTKYFTNYGGRGIRVCDEWRNNFKAFLDHIGPRPSPDYSVDRIDGDGHYEPGNVRWATRSEQQQNRRDRKSKPAKLRKTCRARMYTSGGQEIDLGWFSTSEEAIAALERHGNITAKPLDVKGWFGAQ